MMMRKGLTCTLDIQQVQKSLKMYSPITAWGMMLFLVFTSSSAMAHNIPWRQGESRQLGFGHCAKGPCQMRTCWSDSRPHKHVDGEVIFDRYMTPTCWRSESRAVVQAPATSR